MPLVANALGARLGGMSVEGVDCVRLTCSKRQSTSFFYAEHAPLSRIFYFMGKPANFTPRAFATKGFTP